MVAVRRSVRRDIVGRRLLGLEDETGRGSRDEREELRELGPRRC